MERTVKNIWRILHKNNKRYIRVKDKLIKINSKLSDKQLINELKKQFSIKRKIKK